MTDTVQNVANQKGGDENKRPISRSIGDKYSWWVFLAPKSPKFPYYFHQPYGKLTHWPKLQLISEEDRWSPPHFSPGLLLSSLNSSAHIPLPVFYERVLLNNWKLLTECWRKERLYCYHFNFTHLTLYYFHFFVFIFYNFPSPSFGEFLCPLLRSGIFFFPNFFFCIYME